MRNSLLSLCLVFLSLSVFADGYSSIALQTKPVDIKSANLLRKFVRDEKKNVDSLSLRKIVEWHFGEKSGEILLVDVKTAGVVSCIIYIKDEGVYRSLGGNEFCSWKKAPKLVWRDKFAWLEFPVSSVGRKNIPVALRELTVHFSKASGGVCVLGLPSVGFDSLRCPDDEAPESI